MVFFRWFSVKRLDLLGKTRQLDFLENIASTCTSTTLNEMSSFHSVFLVKNWIKESDYSNLSLLDLCW